MLAFFRSVDSVHDKKIMGLTIDPRVAQAKSNLRALRSNVEAVGKMYAFTVQVTVVVLKTAKHSASTKSPTVSVNLPSAHDSSPWF